MSFWNGKRVTVTGGDGFLGRHVVQYLWEQGAIISVPTIKQFDLRDSRLVDEMYRRLEPEIVINLAAAVGGISANISQPGTFFYDNVMMGMNLIEGACYYGVEKFVQMGSACEYPRDAVMPLVETDVWNGYPEGSNAAYGIAKRALLVMGQAYRQQHGMNIIHLLPTNLYGPGDNFGKTSHFIPAMIVKAVDAVKYKASAISVWGTGEATRDFLYVDDAAEGIALATEHYNEAEPVNLGSGKEWKIKEIAYMIAVLSKFKGELIWDITKPDGQPRRVLDVSRAKKFGFEASTLLQAGLSRTIEWYNAR